MKDLIDSAIREVNQHFDSVDDTDIVLEELKSFFLAKLPEDFDYQGNQTNLKETFCDEGHNKRQLGKLVD